MFRLLLISCQSVLRCSTQVKVDEAGDAVYIPVFLYVSYITVSKRHEIYPMFQMKTFVICGYASHPLRLPMPNSIC